MSEQRRWRTAHTPHRTGAGQQFQEAARDLRCPREGRRAASSNTRSHTRRHRVLRAAGSGPTRGHGRPSQMLAALPGERGFPMGSCVGDLPP